jgi:hypothetical protein
MRRVTEILIAGVSLLLAGACFALLCIGRRSASSARPLATSATSRLGAAGRAGPLPAFSTWPTR